MTLAQALEQVQAIKPNAVPNAVQVAWLNDVDHTIFKEIVQTHQYGDTLVFIGYTAEDAAKAEETVLLAPEPYSRLYLFWLMSQIDIYRQEFDLYANDAALFNKAFADYRNYYNRKIPPLQAGCPEQERGDGVCCCQN